MPYTDLNDIRLYYEGAGEGEPLVFLHGFTLDRRMWRPQVEFFQHHYHVITPDARGHGLSDAPLSGYSRADRVKDLLGLVDNLGIESFHLVGLSMGGATALGFALAHQERLKSLTLVSTGAAGYSIGKKISYLDQVAHDEGPEAALDKWKDWSLKFYKEDRRELKELLDTMISDHSAAAWRDPMRGKYPREDDLSRVAGIKVPTLICAGERDKVFVTLATELNDRIAGSLLTIYPGAGHMLNLEEPNRFNADLKVFLEGVAAEKMNYFEVKDRLESLVRFRALYFEYIGFTNREENPAAHIVRQKMEPLAPITVESLRQVGFGGMVTRDAPAHGGRKIRINLIKAIFRDNIIRRFSLTDREPLDLLDKGILAYRRRLWVEKLQLFNPLFWVYQIVLWTARLPITVCRAAGYDTSKAERAAAVKLYVLLFQVGFYFMLAKSVGLFSWLRADIIAL